MDNRLQAVLVLLLAILGFAAATRMFLQNRPNACLTLLLITSLFLKIFSAAPASLHPWDERYHALVAKNLLAHPLTPTLYESPVLGYNPADWQANHIWLHKPPLTLWLIAGSLKLLGTAPFAVRTPSILLSTLCIFLTWQIARRLFDTRIAFFAALFHTLCGILIAQAAGSFSTDHIDTTFLFFIELGIFFAVLHREKRQWRYALLIGLSIGLALLTKWAAAFIVLPVWLTLVWNRRPLSKFILAVFLAVAVAGIVAAPWQLYIRHNFPTETRIESEYNWKHLFAPVEDHENPWYYHFGKAYEFFGILVYPGLYLAAKLFFRRLLPKNTGPFMLWWALTYVVFTLAATRMGGYVLIAAPAIFIVMALILAHLQDEAQRKEETRAWSAVLFLLFTFSAAAAIVQRMNLFNRTTAVPPWQTALDNVERQIPPGPVILFNDVRPIETMFATNAVAYRQLPTRANIETATRAGYQVVILHPHDSPPFHTLPDNVRIIDAPPVLWDE